MGFDLDFNMYGIVTPEELGNPFVVYWLAILATVSMVLSLAAFMSYKKRQLQIKLAQLNLVMQIVFIIGIFYAIESGMDSFSGFAKGFEPDYQLGAYFSLLPLIFIFLAIRFIKKDDAMVRAADRIR